MNYEELHLTLASVAVLLAAAIVVTALLVRRQRQTIRKRLAVIEREQALNDQLARQARQRGLDPDAVPPDASPLSAVPFGASPLSAVPFGASPSSAVPLDASKAPRAEQLTIHFDTSDSL